MKCAEYHGHGKATFVGQKKLRLLGSDLCDRGWCRSDFRSCGKKGVATVNRNVVISRGKSGSKVKKSNTAEVSQEENEKRVEKHLT